MMRKFELLPNVDLPKPARSTKKAAGYDIRSNEDVIIQPGTKEVIGTGVTVICNDDEFLDLRIRSGLAFKHNLTMQNDCGVIDADYYPKEIMVMIRNEGTKPFEIKKGDRIAQGIFLKYLITDDDSETEKQERTDGLGHTGVK